MGCTTQLRVCKIGLVLFESEYTRAYLFILSEFHLFMKARDGDRLALVPSGQSEPDLHEPDAFTFYIRPEEATCFHGPGSY